MYQFTPPRDPNSFSYCDIKTNPTLSTLKMYIFNNQTFKNKGHKLKYKKIAKT